MTPGPTPEVAATRCPICGGRDFAAVESIEFGNWEPATAGPLTAWTVRLDIEGCVACGHVMITTPYDDAMISRIYLETPQDEVYWGDQVDDSMAPYRQMVTFAGTLPTAGGLIADLGCGTGKLIAALHDAHALPVERVIGVDFNRRVDEGVPFRRADLDRLAEGDLPDDLGFVFAAHLLEHLRDPRRFIEVVARALPPGGGLYVEVPNAADDDPALVGPVNLVNQQHIHYFSAKALARLVTAAGFALVAIDGAVTGSMPRLRCLARRAEAPPTSTAPPPADTKAAAAVAGHVAILRAKRRALADAAMEAIARDGRVALWGLGADFRRTVAENPRLRAEIGAGRVALVDRDLAGRTFDGRPVLETGAIAGIDADTLITPTLGDVRRRMRRYAATLPDGGARVIDVHGRPLPRR